MTIFNDKVNNITWLTVKMANQALKPEPFKGSTDQDVDDWLDSFSRYAEFANWNQQKKYSALKSLTLV